VEGFEAPCGAGCGALFGETPSQGAMVDQNSPTCRFGNPPDPTHPAPHFPGVSSTYFNPVEASTVYTDMIKREKAGRWVAQVLSGKQGSGASHGNRGEELMRMGDMMPGYASVQGVYQRTGWKVHPTTRRPMAPDVQMQPPDDESDVAASRPPGGARLPPLRQEKTPGSNKEKALGRSRSACTLARASPPPKASASSACGGSAAGGRPEELSLICTHLGVSRRLSTTSKGAGGSTLSPDPDCSRRKPDRGSPPASCVGSDAGSLGGSRLSRCVSEPTLAAPQQKKVIDDTHLRARDLILQRVHDKDLALC